MLSLIILFQFGIRIYFQFVRAQCENLKSFQVAIRNSNIVESTGRMLLNS
jgi:hypothetical protein